MAKKVEIILYIFLLFLLIIGLFLVSAGLFLYINIIPIIPSIILKLIGMIMLLQRKLEKIKIVVDDTKHIQLLGACIPNDGILMML